MSGYCGTQRGTRGLWIADCTVGLIRNPQSEIRNDTKTIDDCARVPASEQPFVTVHGMCPVFGQYQKERRHGWKASRGADGCLKSDLPTVIGNDSAHHGE
jgi:hypothetical protein